MTQRQFAEIKTHSATSKQYGKDKSYERKNKPRRFVVAVTECQICGIKRTCVNEMCVVCLASL